MEGSNVHLITILDKVCKVCLLGDLGACPPGFRSFLVPFWGEIARVEQPTANIVFEAFGRSQNLKMCMALLHSAEAAKQP